MNIHKNDYVLSFWVQGVSIFVTDIHVDVYTELEVLFLIDNGLFKQYFTKTAYQKTLEKGLQFYSDEHAFLFYKKELTEFCEEFRRFFQKEIQGKNVLSKEIVQTFFDYTIKLCKDYTKMNSEFTDKAFLKQSSNPIIQKNVSMVGELKATIRSFMNMVLFESSGYSAQVFHILGTQFTMDDATFGNLTQQEILDVYEHILPDVNAVSKRQSAFAITFDRRLKLEGERAQEIIKQFRDDVDNQYMVTGTPACVGKIQGKVKVINVDYTDFKLLSDEIEKMDQGDILIAETTAPELIVACHKAAAIVTDVGGLLSHAAIVSREFGIPCIVGTQHATKIFKDGDIVEVDAEKGIVKKISQWS